uniref:Uncharacterized protein n=1 Tax=Marseillevirus LCMAC202 TaxID=2506606 RepID=A0A481YZ37_9VIRU|nr:MAG: hypothetical protein LCMAC202_04570 [Marseillevirus LCMAC202]
MPFKSEAQRRACWAHYHKDKKAGRKPKWDCEEWEAATRKAHMTGLKVVQHAQQDLLTFNIHELMAMARHQGIPDHYNSCDLSWMLAIHNYLDK